MNILGIDPGSRKMGYAAIKVINNKAIYLGSGVIRFKNLDNFFERIGEIYSSVSKIMGELDFSEVALESLINVKNVNSLSKLAQARGAMVAAAMQYGDVKVFEYSPNLIKSSVSGFGHADKLSIQRSLELVFNQKFNFKTDDESDALAIAYGHWCLRGRGKERRGSGLQNSIDLGKFKGLK